MTESHRTEPHTIHTKGRNTTRSGIVFHHFPTLRRLLRRQAVIAALGPVCRAASNFDNGIAPGAAHGCAPYPAGQSPTFLTGSGSAIAAIDEARRMRTPPSDGAILEHFVMAITAFRHSPNHDGQGAIVTHSTGYRFMNKLDAPTESNVRPLKNWTRFLEVLWTLTQ